MDSVEQKDLNPVNGTQNPPPTFRSFEIITTAVKDPKVLRQPLLKSLYYLLMSLSLDSPFRYSSFGASDFFDNGSHQFDFKLTFTDICNLSNSLFKELCRRFEQLFSALHHVTANVVFGQVSIYSDIWGPPEELTLLLRCCMVILRLLEFDQNLLLQKCQILLEILSKLCSPDVMLHISCIAGRNKNSAISFKRSVSRECTYSSDGGITSSVEEFDASLCFIEQSDLFLPFLCSIHEVFVDELLVHRPLRQYFMIFDTVSCTSEKLFMCHGSDGDSDNVLEVISAHFILSYCDEKAFVRFLNRLFWLHGEDFRIPELSLTGAMALLGSSVMLSAPQIFQVHLISLISESIGIDMASKDTRLDPRRMNCYISALERSVILYTKHISSLQLCDLPIAANSEFVSCDKPWLLGREFQPSFESYIRPVTNNIINLLSTKLDDSWNLYSCDMSSRTKTDLMTASIAYMKENQYVLDKSFRDEILSILSCIIYRTFSGDLGDTVLLENGDVSQQEMYRLASILKLMSSSMLQTTWCMRQSGNSGCLKTLKDYSLCREYDFIVGFIGCFRKFEVHQPIQKLLYDVMETYPARHKETKLMLMHFSGLLLLSFDRGLEFLSKGCIFMMMTLMNLFIFEEGNLDALRPLLGFGKEPLSSGSSPVKDPEALVGQKPSLIVASKFQKIQILYLRTATLAGNSVGTRDGEPEDLENTLLKDVQEDTCDGEIFIKCIKERHGKQSDFDDLADFIECKQGKDYSSWLKDRQKYRKWKCEKMTVVRKERKKKSWKLMKGKRN
ncbi:hypothetical protein HHK36_004440 [Tetracentron sinense]|uniref:DUF7812 domain-containing protein n=1 Tax=Tetracentron sinense TaxID=13715 RepID=A0A834ZSZ6_TETSI|nr:hypothetical protein HHK36_004440 [Tetracentron sinense]